MPSAKRNTHLISAAWRLSPDWERKKKILSQNKIQFEVLRYPLKNRSCLFSRGEYLKINFFWRVHKITIHEMYSNKLIKVVNVDFFCLCGNILIILYIHISRGLIVVLLCSEDQYSWLLVISAVEHILYSYTVMHNKKKTKGPLNSVLHKL